MCVKDGFITNGVDLFLYLRKNQDKSKTVKFQIILMSVLHAIGYSPHDLECKYTPDLVESLCEMADAITDDIEFIDFIFSDSLDVRNRIAEKYNVQGLLNLILSMEL